MYLGRARRETLRALGLPTDLAEGEPAPFAPYIVAEEATGRQIGMTELPFLDQVFESRDQVPYRALLPSSARFDELASIRTIWVEPGDRVVRPVFTALYTAACHVARGLGARLLLFKVIASRPSLVRLYERTGARYLGETAENAIPGVRILLYALDPEEVARNPRHRRFATSMEIDWAKARRIRRRRAIMPGD